MTEILPDWGPPHKPRWTRWGLQRVGRRGRGGADEDAVRAERCGLSEASLPRRLGAGGP